MALIGIAAVAGGLRASASIVTTTIQGTVASGTDTSGVFGLPQRTDLSGQSFTLTFTFDDNKGIQGCNGYYPPCISQIYGLSASSSPGMAILQIAGGSYSFGTLGLGTAYANPPTVLPSYVTLAENNSVTYLFYSVIDQSDGSNSDSIGGIILPAGGSSFPITSWEGSFSASGINTLPQSFGFTIGTTSSTATGLLNPTSIVTSGPQGVTYGQENFFVIPTQPWTDTGVYLAAGEGLNITASGLMDYNTNNTCASGSSCTVGPDGANPGVPCGGDSVVAPNLPCTSLIARIGNGQPFEVGTSFNSGAISASGELFLGVNDSYFADNTLGWTAIITRAQGVATTSGLQFIPTAPCRLVDTRGAAGTFGGPELGASSTREFDIPQQTNCGIPSTAVAYSVNVTVVPNTTLQYLTLWPSGEPQPNVSTLNSYDGRIKANAAIVPAGSNGGVNVFTSDASQVILDIDGYFVPAGTANAMAFYPVTPCRLVDTRGATDLLGGPFLSGLTSRAFPLLNNTACGIPPNAQAYSLNVTTIPHKTLNYLTTWPTGEAQPNVSTLNAPTGAIAANAAIVPAGANGEVSVFVSDDADVILDVNGYFAAPGTGGLSLYTATPCRALDTRGSLGPFDGVLKVDMEGSTCAPPSTARAYVLNATVVPPGQLGYLTTWPDGEAQPNVSTLNAGDGAITSNLAIVPTQDGAIDAFSSDSTQLILDLSSYFAP